MAILGRAWRCHCHSCSTAVVAVAKREAPPVDLSHIPTRRRLKRPLSNRKINRHRRRKTFRFLRRLRSRKFSPNFTKRQLRRRTTTQRPTAPIKAPAQAARPGVTSISEREGLGDFRSATRVSLRSAQPPPYRKWRLRAECRSGSGSVTDATMAQSIGNPILDNATVSAFRRWRFKPGRVSKGQSPDHLYHDRRLLLIMHVCFPSSQETTPGSRSFR